jgi:hypothetical protein
MDLLRTAERVLVALYLFVLFGLALLLIWLVT